MKRQSIYYGTVNVLTVDMLSMGQIQPEDLSAFLRGMTIEKIFQKSIQNHIPCDL